jgi:methylglyoxal reductase
MQMRPLGQTGIEASAVAFGAWAIGGWMWGGADEGESIDAIHASLDSGVNFIDTAPIYGFGRSEEIVGKAIRRRRDQVILATKCSMVCNPNVGEPKFRCDGLGANPNGIIPVHIYLGPDSIREEVEQSLRRLRTDYIDLYQTHWQEATTPIEDTMGALLDLKQQGKIRAIGVCNATLDQIKQYTAAGQLDSDQECYSMLDRQIEGSQLPYTRQENIAVLAYSPLARGLLTGKIGPDREFGPGDHRAMMPRFSKKNRQQVTTLLDAFQPIAEAHNATLAQIVIAWTIRQPGVTHALCGARNVAQAQENAAAGNLELTDEQLQQMDAAIEQHAGTIR